MQATRWHGHSIHRLFLAPVVPLPLPSIHTPLLVPNFVTRASVQPDDARVARLDHVSHYSSILKLNIIPPPGTPRCGSGVSPYYVTLMTAIRPPPPSCSVLSLVVWCGMWQ